MNEQRTGRHVGDKWTAGGLTGGNVFGLSL
jgi:hypothetical protein